MDDKNCIEEPKKKKNWGAGGGLYRGTKVSIKVLDKVIVILLILLVGVVIYLASTGHYTIQFETNGGESIPAYQCKYDEYIQVNTPSKTGYTFAGWFEDSDLTKPFDVKTITVKASGTLYASWTPSMIHVSFDLDGGNVGGKTTIDAKDIPFHEVYGILPTPKKTGKDFLGWTYNGVLIKEDTPVTMNGEHTLKAVWK